jgi:hypothetical protein
MSRITPVGPRVPKDEFMRALHLDTNNPQHEGIYRAMRVRRFHCNDGWFNTDISQKDEAIAVYNRINADRSSLIEEQRNNQATKAPFFWHHIRPDRRRQAIMETWHQARRGTDARRLFDYGQTDGEHAPNWVTLWLLYSVFRSRDIRNNRNRRNDESRPATNGEIYHREQVADD